MVFCASWICIVVYRLYYVHVGYAMLCTSGVVCMWYIGTMYIWCGVVYMLYEWRCVNVVLCTCRVCGVVYMWCCIHVMCVVLCTCGILYALYSGAMYMWRCVQVVQVVLGTCGTGVRVGLSACRT